MLDDDQLALLHFIRDELLVDPAIPVSSTTRLISEGLIDSFAVARMAAFIEDRFGIRFDDLEIRADTRETVADILALVRKRQP